MYAGAVPLPPGLVAVVVHGPATDPLATILFGLGLRPLSGTTGPTVWLPATPAGRVSK